MLEIEKPIIECIESNEDGTYGKYVVEPLRKRIWYYTWKCYEKNTYYHHFQV